ncbi:hypothetical protein [Nonomuraea zeae]|uniref:hypothetical protein n=1 Tax=Nonomuraea zeae TaxID=1642303 RepID=UPI0036106493
MNNEQSFEDFMKALIGTPTTSSVAAEMLAGELWTLFEALKNKGFDEYQAFELTREGIRAIAAQS